MPAITGRTENTQTSLGRWIVLGAIAALGAFVLETVLKPTSAVGPILFAIFIAGLLTVVVVSVILIMQRRRVDRGV
jgi:uncharacterized membrane protein